MEAEEDESEDEDEEVAVVERKPRADCASIVRCLKMI